jgi:hypothetical protein
MLLHASMSYPYWTEALATATYILNKCFSSIIRNHMLDSP